MPLTIQQLTVAFNALKSFRNNSSMFSFEQIFGEEMAEHYWFKFSQTYHCDAIAFYGYVDEAYKEVLLNYILTNIVPKMEAKV